jgi:hypothetical protein
MSPRPKFLQRFTSGTLTLKEIVKSEMEDSTGQLRFLDILKLHQPSRLPLSIAGKSRAFFAPLQ